MLRISLGFVVASLALSQTFDAVSIKPAPPPSGGMLRVSCSGGPGTGDPGLFTCENLPLPMLVMRAYDIQRFQLSGSASLDGERFNITARIPSGATKEQFRGMLQNLLAERFKLAVHRERKELPVYNLVVAKSGPKLKQTDPDAPASGGTMKPDKDGFPDVPKIPGQPLMMMANGRARSSGTAVSMDDLAKFLGSATGGRPVVNATKLSGKYDYTLNWMPDNMVMPPGVLPPHPAPEAAPDADSGPSLFTAIEEQLGLKLEAGRGMVDMLVIDHIEKSPTDN